MKRVLLLVPVLALAIALGACGGSGDEAAPTTTEALSTSASDEAELPGEPVLAGWSKPAGTEIFLADPLTLEPVDGRAVEVPFFSSAAALSPDATQLALGGNAEPAVQIVDLDEMRTTSTIDAGLGEWVERLHWASQDLLLASLSGLRSYAAAIEPQTGKVIHSAKLDGVVLGSAPAGEGIAFLLAEPDTIGPARVAFYDGRALRSATLADVPAGYRSEGDAQEYRTSQSIPGLAVDPEGTRALVVPAGNRVAELDLETMEVGYHDLAEPVSLLGRLRNWLEPAAHAKSIDGPARNAVWLPSGLVAVSGAQYVADGDTLKMVPAGLSLIDPGDWSVSRLSDEPSWATFRDDALLASVWSEGSDEQKVIVFSPAGTPRFTRSQGTDFSTTAGGLLYASSHEGTVYELVDLVTGETVAEAQPRRETFLLYLD